MANSGFSNLYQFNLGLDDFLKDVDLEFSEVIFKLALDLHSGLTKATPRDTGRASNNWFPSSGEPATEINYDNFDPINPADYLPNPEDLPRHPIIWLSNNVPYIIYLNEGTSKQAPSNFVELESKRVLGKFLV